MMQKYWYSYGTSAFYGPCCGLVHLTRYKWRRLQSFGSLRYKYNGTAFSRIAVHTFEVFIKINGINQRMQELEAHARWM